MAIKKADFKYEIVKNLGVISEGKSGWRKELNYISWNGGAPKYDVRDWDSERQKMGKGVTLTESEIQKLYELIGEKIPNTQPNAQPETQPNANDEQ
ncbi:MAG: hypothetical protein LBT62_03255 [Deltaproteobacteria bacterium]|jgi:hypothetical protein|nr:hypothetical protein [Deltaproteobacteria bacterium]